MIVQKYGGAALKNLENISQIAGFIARYRKQNEFLIVVVSAMGNTTDELHKMACSFDPRPSRRELDMLLSSGERISMSLLCIALESLNCHAVSYTGSQAGILTSSSHNQAKIVGITPNRIKASLENGRVVVLAGFQGVHSETKEITTLGRGGSDTTAIAMADSFNAARCEMYKDVGGVFTGDPHCIKDAILIPYLPYEILAEICYWGGKIIQYRAVELAWKKSIPIFIASIDSPKSGTLIQAHPPKEMCTMIEEQSLASVNSHSHILKIHFESDSIDHAHRQINDVLNEQKLAWPQVLSCTKFTNNIVEFMMTDSKQQVDELLCHFKKSISSLTGNKDFSSVTAICYGSYRSSLISELVQILESNDIQIEKIQTSSMSVTFYVLAKNREKAQSLFHNQLVAERKKK